MNLTKTDLELIHRWMDLEGEARGLINLVEIIRSKQATITEQIEAHTWVMNCSGKIVFVGSKEEVWDYAKKHGQIPLDDDDDSDGCQFADRPLPRGIPIPIWGTAMKVKPTKPGWNWAKIIELMEIRKKQEEDADDSLSD